MLVLLSAMIIIYFTDLLSSANSSILDSHEAGSGVALQRDDLKRVLGEMLPLLSSFLPQCTVMLHFITIFISSFLTVHQSGKEVSPSTLFAVASILEGCAYINGSPQNTFVPGAIELAVEKGVFIGGDDFKSGQTKIKSVLVDFLVSAGIKVRD